MKKKLLFALCALLVVLGLAGCSINAETTISFTNPPKATYASTETYQSFMDGVTVKVGNGVADTQYTLTQILGVEGVTVTLDGSAISSDKWGVGTHTLVVTYQTVHCDFTFVVTDATSTEQPVGKVEPSYTWYTASATSLTIATAGELVGFANIVNGLAEGITQDDFEGKTVKLSADIDLTDVAWTPIGQGPRKYSSDIASRSLSAVTTVFRGTFDGQNYTIKGLSNKSYQPSLVDETTYANSNGIVVRGYTFGLFGRAENAVFKNLKMTKVSIDGEITFNGKLYCGDSIGAVLGYSWGNVTFENIQVGAEGDMASISGYDGIGIICGRAYGADSGDNKALIMTNCKGYGNSTSGTGKTCKASGLVGYSAKKLPSTLTNCYYKGTVSTTSHAYITLEKIYLNAGSNDMTQTGCSSDATLVLLTPAA